MAQEKAQNFENHSRVVPPYHMFVIPVFMINFVWRLVQLKYGLTFVSIMNVLLAAAFIVLVLYARLFSLTVQDRVIRLEMRLRLERRCLRTCSADCGIHGSAAGFVALRVRSRTASACAAGAG